MEHELPHNPELSERPWTLEKFGQILAAVKTELDDIYDDDSLDSAKQDKLVGRRIDRFVDELKVDPKRFRHVFETSQGSVYVTLATSESLRIKRISATGVLSRIQSILGHVVFLSPEGVQELLKLKDDPDWQRNIVNTSLADAGCNPGNSPFEFGLQGFPEQLIERTGNSIKLLGAENGSFSSGAHIGHPISKIY